MYLWIRDFLRFRTAKVEFLRFPTARVESLCFSTARVEFLCFRTEMVEFLHFRTARVEFQHFHKARIEFLRFRAARVEFLRFRAARVEFLRFRAAKVELDKESEQLTQNPARGPQSGIISPTIFLIFINNKTENLKKNQYQELSMQAILPSGQPQENWKPQKNRLHDALTTTEEWTNEY